MVHQRIKLYADADFEREGGDAETDVETEDVLERDSQNFAVAKNSVGVDIGAYIEERFLASDVVKLPSCNMLCSTRRQIGVSQSNCFRRINMDLVTWSCEHGSGGSEKGQKECGCTHVAICEAETIGRWSEGEERW